MLVNLVALFISTLVLEQRQGEAGRLVSVSIPTAAVSQAHWSQEDEKTIDFSSLTSSSSSLHSPERQD